MNLRGHRTSVSLEPEFWAAFREAAAAENLPINELAARIDAARGTDCGLASAIRLVVLRWIQTGSLGVAKNAKLHDGST